ncbi:MAG: A/G-specific adenine glycosylase, partial [Pseudomonadota bacterium]
REVPWRVKSGEVANPYHVWLSEIMCQQTTVQAVKAYYTKFLDMWPTVEDLAAAKGEDVMAAWAGLGYYARARNLHKCAQIVANDLGGKFPSTQEELKKLPGVGDYTSAAIAAIAFNEPATVVDGNVERVMARFFAIEEPLPNSKKTLKVHAEYFYRDFDDRPGDLAQSFMDLGAGICIPKAPRCMLCPSSEDCEGRRLGIAAELPKKAKKKDRPQKYGHLYWVENEDGEVLFQQRPEKGLLGGMLGLPTTGWEKNKKTKHLEYLGEPIECKHKVHHTFTHFDLELRLYKANLTKDTDLSAYGLKWLDPDKTGEKLPSVFKKGFKIFSSL